MRPKIPDNLAERITRVHKSAGYATESEFIRDAIRRRLDEIESSSKAADPDRIYDFEYTLVSNKNQLESGSYPPLYVRPEGGRIANRADTEEKLVLSVNSKDIEEETIQNAFENVDAVSHCSFTRRDPWERKSEKDGWIKISLAEPRIEGRDIDTVIGDVFEQLQETINDATGWENPHDELEDALRRHTRGDGT